MEPKKFQRGRKYEALEKSEWVNLDGNCEAYFEKSVPLISGRGGRIDVLIDEKNGNYTIIEIKSTNWEKIMPHRIRPNVLRHIQQIIGYWDYFDGNNKPVCLAICYPSAPKQISTRRIIEEIFLNKGIQIVWTKERGINDRPGVPPQSEIIAGA